MYSLSWESKKVMRFGEDIEISKICLQKKTQRMLQHQFRNARWEELWTNSKFGSMMSIIEGKGRIAEDSDDNLDNVEEWDEESTKNDINAAMF